MACTKGVGAPSCDRCPADDDPSRRGAIVGDAAGGAEESRADLQGRPRAGRRRTGLILITRAIDLTLHFKEPQEQYIGLL